MPASAFSSSGRQLSSLWHGTTMESVSMAAFIGFPLRWIVIVSLRRRPHIALRRLQYVPAGVADWPVSPLIVP